MTCSTVSLTREVSTLVGTISEIVFQTLTSAVLPAASAASSVTCASSAWGWKMLPMRRPMITPQAEVAR